MNKINQTIARKPIIELVNRQAVTSSFEVARYFGKRHDHVIRDIDNLISKVPDFAKPNFGVCYRINELQNGKPQKYYNMTKDGFTLLAMGFSGEKALKFKISYINAFKEKERQIAQIKTSALAEYMQQVKELAEDKALGSLAGKHLRIWRDKKTMLESKLEIKRSEIEPLLPFFEN